MSRKNQHSFLTSANTRKPPGAYNFSVGRNQSVNTALHIVKSIRSVPHYRWLYKIFYKRKGSDRYLTSISIRTFSFTIRLIILYAYFESYNYLEKTISNSCFIPSVAGRPSVCTPAVPHSTVKYNFPQNVHSPLYR